MYLRFNRVTYYFLEDPIYQKITARMQRSVLVEISPAILLPQKYLSSISFLILSKLLFVTSTYHFSIIWFLTKGSTPQLMFKDLECVVSSAEEGIQHLKE